MPVIFIASQSAVFVGGRCGPMGVAAWVLGKPIWSSPLPPSLRSDVVQMFYKYYIHYLNCLLIVSGRPPGVAVFHQLLMGDGALIQCHVLFRMGRDELSVHTFRKKVSRSFNNAARDAVIRESARSGRGRSYFSGDEKAYVCV